MPQKFLILLTALMAVGILCPLETGAEEPIQPGEILTLEKTVAIAIKNHPTLAAAAHAVMLQQARAGQAASDYYPRISASAGYRRDKFDSGGGTTGVAPSSDITEQYSSSLTLSQNLYDFGRRPRRVAIQNLNLDASRTNLADVSDQQVFTVKQAYYGVLRARRNRDVAVESVRRFEQHREQARGFYEVGTKPKFDLTKAEVDLSNARVSLIQAENGLRIARVTLNHAMGIVDPPEYDVEDNLSFQEYPITLEEAVRQGYEARPALRSAVVRREAAARGVDLAVRGHFPALTGTAGVTWAGETFPLDRGWNVGAALSVPIFSGFETEYQVREARELFGVAEAEEALLRQKILLEMQQAYWNREEAEERIPVAELTVRQAEENLEIAQGRYAAGVGTPIEVTDAEVGLTEAKTAYIQALYDAKIAQADMERAMGTR